MLSDVKLSVIILNIYSLNVVIHSTIVLKCAAPFFNNSKKSAFFVLNSILWFFPKNPKFSFFGKTWRKSIKTFKGSNRTRQPFFGGQIIDRLSYHQMQPPFGNIGHAEKVKKKYCFSAEKLFQQKSFLFMLNTIHYGHYDNIYNDSPNNNFTCY